MKNKISIFQKSNNVYHSLVNIDINILNIIMIRLSTYLLILLKKVTYILDNGIKVNVLVGVNRFEVMVQSMKDIENEIKLMVMED